MTVSIRIGDVRDQLRLMPDNHFDCIVTSPPYWGLRDYGVAGQIGLEPTLGEHLGVMVDLFRDLRRVLKPSGTCWLNYGDCYATAPNGRSAADTKAAGGDDRTFRDKPFSTVGGTMKPKDLCMIPNRLAIALQDDGWWVRSEIVWGKTNPMPESITDRPATSHEKVFLLTKSARYFYDATAVRQESVGKTLHDLTGGRHAPPGQKPRAGSRAHYSTPAGWDTSVGSGGHGSVHREGRCRASEHASIRHAGHICHTTLDQTGRGSGRALRNFEPAEVEVWPMATRPFACELCRGCGRFYNRKQAAALKVETLDLGGGRTEKRRFCACGSHDGWLSHFATFPRTLVERCLDAGAPETCCDACGAPRTRQIAVTYENPGNRQTNGPRSLAQRHETPGFAQRLERRVETLGFEATCACRAGVEPGRVLDPFGGAGTTAMVAAERGMDCTLIELNPDYATLAMHRIADADPTADIEMGAG